MNSFCPQCQNIINVKINNENNNINYHDILLNKSHDKITLTYDQYDELITLEKYKKMSKNNKEDFEKNIIKVKNSSAKNKCVYFCDFCNYENEVPPETCLYDYSINDLFDNDIELNNDLQHVPYLLHTVNYICPNDKCETNTKNVIKDAIIHNKFKSLKKMYSCLICNTSFYY